jgi:hypothetical protein
MLINLTKQTEKNGKKLKPVEKFADDTTDISIEKKIFYTDAKEFDLYRKLDFVLTSGFIETYVNKNGETKKKFNGTKDWVNNPKFDEKKSAHGILTGKISNITVIDIDDMSIESNIKIDEMCKKSSNLCVRSRKGKHYYFKYTNELSTTSSTKHALDIRNDGGMIFCPPSKYVFEDINVIYTFEMVPKNNQKLNEMPEDLINYIKKLYDVSHDKKTEKILNKEIKIDNEFKNINNNEKFSDEIVSKILKYISIDHARDYESWIRVCIILKNENYKSELFEEFSKRCQDKYVEGEATNVYNYMNLKNIHNKISIGTLLYWLKNDNKYIFDEVIKDIFEEKLENDYNTVINYGNEYDQYDMKQYFDRDIEKYGPYVYAKNINRTISFRYFNYFHFYIELSDSYYMLSFDKNIKLLEKIENINEYQKYFLIDDKNFVKLWMKSMDKQMYKKIEFDPTNKMKGIYNLFCGFKYDNPEKNYTYDIQKIKHIIDLIKHVTINDENFNFVIKWASRILQKPDRKTEIVIVLYSRKHGVGKNTIVELLMKMFEGYFCKIEKIDDLTCNFNSNLAGKLICYGDEIRARAKDISNELKNMITRTKMNLEIKGKDKRLVNDYLNYIFTTNNELAFFIEQSDRRYFMCECTDDKLSRSKYDKFYKSLDDEDILKHFFNYLISQNVNDMSLPMNDYKRRIMSNSLPPYIRMIYDNYKQYEGESKRISELYEESKLYASKNYMTVTYSKDKLSKDFTEEFGEFKVKKDSYNIYIFPEYLYDLLKIKNSDLID